MAPDPAIQVAALSELVETVNHQNSIHEATAPAALCVAGILTHPAAANLRAYRNVPIRATLLNWLASVAYDASDETVGRIERYFPGSLTPGTTMAAFRGLAAAAVDRAAVQRARDAGGCVPRRRPRGGRTAARCAGPDGVPERLDEPLSTRDGRVRAVRDGSPWAGSGGPRRRATYRC